MESKKKFFETTQKHPSYTLIRLPNCVVDPITCDLFTTDSNSSSSSSNNRSSNSNSE